MYDKNPAAGEDPFGVSFENLPGDLPIFPLPGAMLLPHGRMPLNIFEPRYLKMIMDSLKQSRLIGMVQPLELLPDPIPQKTDLFHVGCAGRITSFAESDDGQFLITLKGVCRFKIKKELAENGFYRRINPDFSDFKSDLTCNNPRINRDGLLPLLKDYLKVKGIEINIADFVDIEDRFLIPTLCMINPFDFREKQAILEIRDINEMADVIISLMEMELISTNSAPTKH
ncbi:LON peptidase substrate-binding domain-containing protein [Gammaproteobacteria bacterium]|nr:LON peptidase substrate-binding domain-containing protein [Gammaproteobacteria bacterium]